jgi:hypothetical protein
MTTIFERQFDQLAQDANRTRPGPLLFQGGVPELASILKRSGRAHGIFADHLAKLLCRNCSSAELDQIVVTALVEGTK